MFVEGPSWMRTRSRLRAYFRLQVRCMWYDDRESWRNFSTPKIYQLDFDHVIAMKKLAAPPQLFLRSNGARWGFRLSQSAKRERLGVGISGMEMLRTRRGVGGRGKETT